MREVKYDELLAISQGDAPADFRDLPSAFDTTRVTQRLEDYFTQERESDRTVLGIDIYKYSRYEPAKQRLIPFVFSHLYQRTIHNLRERQSLLFRADTSSYRSCFIPTGDGGFQILDSPIHAIAFALFFEINLQIFNGFGELHLIREFVGPLTVRWCITLDRVYRFDGNHFGAAIINNARILAKDSLNRFLFDSNVMNWFYRHIGSVESIALMDTADIHRALKLSSSDSGSDSIFGQGRFSTILSQRIGELHTKDRTLDVYSLFMQRPIITTDDADGTKKRPLVVSLDNTNAAGFIGEK